MITRKEIIKGRDKYYPLSSDLEKHLKDLLLALNMFRQQYGKPMIITSGYRPGSFNRQAGGREDSAHITCQAVDVADVGGDLARYCLENIELLKTCGLYMENPHSTLGWVHLQIRPTIARVFKP